MDAAERPRRPRRAAEAAAGTVPPDLLHGAEPVAEAEPHHHGHRDRLRTRFLARGPDALEDYELLELVLFAVDPRKDVKPLAKELLRSFGGFWNVVNAPPDKLRRVKAGGVSLAGDKAVAAVLAIGAAALRAKKQEIMKRPLLASWDAVVEYCTAAMAHETTEHFRLLFLDRKNQLIADEVQQRGTVDHTPVYPREVVKRALDLGATAIVLVHNHPSGDPTPSRADIDMTKEIQRAAHALGVTVHDHLIIGRGRTYSFKEKAMM